MAGALTGVLRAGWPLAVASVRSSSQKAWIWRWTAAGLNEVCAVASRRLGSALTSRWALTRAYAILVSYAAERLCD